MAEVELRENLPESRSKKKALLKILDVRRDSTRLFLEDLPELQNLKTAISSSFELSDSEDSPQVTRVTRQSLGTIYWGKNFKDDVRVEVEFCLTPTQKSLKQNLTVPSHLHLGEIKKLMFKEHPALLEQKTADEYFLGLSKNDLFMDERVPLSKARPFLELTIATKQTVSLVLTHQQASRRSFMLPNARLAFSNHRRRGFSVGNERETYSSQFDGSSGSTSWKKGVLRPSGEALKSSPLVMEAEGFCMDLGISSAVLAPDHPKNLKIEDAANDEDFYKAYFFGKEHSSWVGFHESLGPVIVSIAHTAISHKFPSLICTQLVDDRGYISETSVKQAVLTRAFSKVRGAPVQALPAMPSTLLKALKKKNVFLEHASLKRIRNVDFPKAMSTFEQLQIISNYKFGVLYAKENQLDEDAMFQNVEMSPEFEKFLTLLGDKIELRGHEGYRGGLNVRDDSTGEHSIYTKYSNYEIMFHVSTLLPYFPDDFQQVERKRHLGNDIVVLVFMDGDTPFSPECIQSEYNHVFFVVRPIQGSDPPQYNFARTAKHGVRPFRPIFPKDIVLTFGDKFRDFLLTSLINAERAAYHAPVFANKITRTRNALLTDIYDTYCA